MTTAVIPSSPEVRLCGSPRSGGFSFIELVVTLGIVSVLAWLTLPVIETQTARVREAELRAALRELRTAIDAYKRASDEGRITRRPEDTGYPPALETLVTGVVDAKDPEGKRLVFLRRVPRDPFAPADIASAADTWVTRSYAAATGLAEQRRDVYDVQSRSQARGLNGVPYAQW